MSEPTIVGQDLEARRRAAVESVFEQLNASPDRTGVIPGVAFPTGNISATYYPNAFDDEGSFPVTIRVEVES